MLLRPIGLAIDVLVSPAPQVRTIWARGTIEDGGEGEQAMLCSESAVNEAHHGC
jgi:hypothetical protein